MNVSTSNPIIIDGKNFSCIDEFWNEVIKVFGFSPKHFGRNLDAFLDYLWDEPKSIIWINAAKSRRDLGYEATAQYWKNKLNTCHPDSRPQLLEAVREAESYHGETLFDMLCGIISESKESFCLEDSFVVYEDYPKRSQNNNIM